MYLGRGDTHTSGVVLSIRGSNYAHLHVYLLEFTVCTSCSTCIAEIVLDIDQCSSSIVRIANLRLLTDTLSTTDTVANMAMDKNQTC